MTQPLFSLATSSPNILPQSCVQQLRLDTVTVLRQSGVLPPGATTEKPPYDAISPNVSKIHCYISITD